MSLGPIRQTDVAIVGMSCRFPGGCKTPDDYWNLLAAGTNAVTQIPEDRWEQSFFLHPNKKAPGRTYTFSAGTLGDISGFDAAFFGISPREADAMDPQQRLLLEMAWEALESGGQTPEHLEGRNCAVYVGISSTEYGSIQQGDLDSANAYMMLGSTLSIAANRISYMFDLRGPSMAIDTACSSSLVALTEALNAIWSGRCDMALAGGVSLLLSPFPFVGFSKATMLSEDGLCRAFAENPHGYVRGEGGGVLVLKPLADAIRDGDPIHAVIEGAGANADGRTRGIALPSHESQRTLIEQTLKKFKVDPRDIDFFEAHGTGTAAGDPAECRAIGEAIGQKRDLEAGPLPIGSAKSNIGHLEPASGMAGLIKTVMALRHRMVPSTLHATPLNPDIDFGALNIMPVLEATTLQTTGRPLRAAINSFGFGGANATVVLREYQQEGRNSGEQLETAPPLILSAKSAPALTEMTKNWAKFLQGMAAEDYYDAAHTAAYKRTRHRFRLVVRGNTVERIGASLAAYASGNDDAGTISGEARTSQKKTAYIFNGNGAQWAGMGRRLYAESTTFRNVVDEIGAILEKQAGWSLVEALHAEDAEELIQQTEIAQPALFAIQVGIAACLSEYGLKADAVAGHSVGEVAAAYVAGAISLEHSIKLVLARSTAQGLTKGQGRMAAAAISPEEALEIERNSGGAVSLAATNTASSVTLVGEESLLLAIGEDLSRRKVFFRMLDLDYAFHSRVLDPVKEQFFELAENIEPTAGSLSFYSTVAGKKMDTERLDAAYWWDNVREPVQFRDVVAAMAEDNISVFVEVGPHAILQSYLRQNARENDIDGTFIASMTKTDDGVSSVRRTVDTAFCSGAHLDLDLFFPIEGKCVSLPAYPWQHERHWFKVSPEAQGGMYKDRNGPFLGMRPQSGYALWECSIDPDLYPFLADHDVSGSIVFPAAAYVEIVLEASAVLFGGSLHEIEMLEIRRPIVMRRGQTTNFRFVYDSDDKAFRIETRKRMSDEPWSLNAVGRLTGAAFGHDEAQKIVLPKIAAGQRISKEEHYKIAEALGLNYGPAFQLVEEVQVSGNTAIARLGQPEPLSPDETDFVLHPALLDGCLQTLFSILFAQGRRTPTAYLPYQLGRLKLFGDTSSATTCYVNLRKQSEKSLVADFSLFDEEGCCLAVAERFRFLRAELRQTGDLAAEYFHFETIPLTYTTEEDDTPGAEDISPAMKPKDICAADGIPDLDAIAKALTVGFLVGEMPERPDGSDMNGHAADLLQTTIESEADETTKKDIAKEGEHLWRESFSLYPSYLAELTAIMQCAMATQSAKTESTGALSSAMRQHLLEDSPSFAPAKEALVEGLKAIVDRWPANRRLRILEVGCANAILQSIISQTRKRGIDLTLVTANEERLSNLQMELESPDTRFLNIDLFGHLSENDERELDLFDVAICPLPSVEGGMSSTFRENLQRVLRPGGLLLLSEVSPRPWTEITFGSYLFVGSSGGVFHHANQEDLVRMLGTSGFVNIHSAKHGCAVVVVAEAKCEPRSTAIAPPLTAPGAEDTNWLVVYDPTGEDAPIAAQLSAELEQRGALVVRAHTHDAGEESEAALRLLSGDEDQWRETYATLTSAGINPQGVVLVGDLSGSSAAGWDALLAARSLAEAGFKRMPRLCIVTRNASGFEPVAQAKLDQAPLWGLARVLANEVPGIHPRIADLRSGNEAEDALVPLLCDWILRDKGVESEIVLSPEGSFGVRLRKAARPKLDETKIKWMEKLVFSTGRLGSLNWQPRPAPIAADDEIVVLPHAAGLNFRDVMYALGVLPEEALEVGFAGPSVGMEAAGTIQAIGRNVTKFKPGDEVICFAPNCFDSHVVTPASAAMLKPANLSFEEAATIPTAFFTVSYALEYLARLRKGERLVIHGAAGGVGLAALQLARKIGAEVFVTVGTREKRNLMKMLGVPADRIFSSRSLKFSGEILAATNGEGVDVVLNSLSGDAIHRSLGLLRPFGRFVELGKRDFYENNRIGLKFFRNNLSYFGVDADQLMAERPDLAQEIFENLIESFEKGLYTPLPYRTFGAEQISSAFRLMQKSGHVGKIVIRPPAAKPAQANDNILGKADIRADATYLVTGGLSGFGLATAHWLAGKGAKRLLLVSRSGTVGDEAQAFIDAVAEQGVMVEAQACDVTDEELVRALFRQADDAGFPIRGVIHAAAVFADGTLTTMDAEQYRLATEPKIKGALALHEATAERDLDFFVMYSSITTAFGNPGQANYVAGNAFLEALAQKRRALGLPGLAIGWGAIGDVGYLARNEEIREQLSAKMGTAPLTSDEAMKLLDDLIGRGESYVYAANMNWQRLKAGLPVLQDKIFGEVAPKLSRGADEDDAQDILNKIRTLPLEEAVALVASVLAEEIGQILRLAPEKIDLSKPFTDLGMDSLMALELKLGVEDRFSVELPIMTLAEGSSINTLAALIARRLRGDDEDVEIPVDVQSIVLRHVGQNDIEAVEKEATPAPPPPPASREKIRRDQFGR